MLHRGHRTKPRAQQARRAESAAFPASLHRSRVVQVLNGTRPRFIPSASQRDSKPRFLPLSRRSSDLQGSLPMEAGLAGAKTAVFIGLGGARLRRDCSPTAKDTQLVQGFLQSGPCA